jgi:hypothetical protein
MASLAKRVLCFILCSLHYLSADHSEVLLRAYYFGYAHDTHAAAGRWLWAATHQPGPQPEPRLLQALLEFLSVVGFAYKNYDIDTYLS